MNKFYGTIGFVKSEESKPGIWEPVTDEHGYCGDLIRSNWRNESTNKINTNVNMRNQVSIICDPFALENLQFIKFVRFLGTAWRVTSVDMQYPRLILELGDVYTEEVEDEQPIEPTD